MFDRNVVIPFHQALTKVIAYSVAPVPGARFSIEACGTLRCMRVDGFAEGAPKKRWIFFLHGGGYNAGSPQTHKNAVAWLCRASGAAALVPDYRMPPGHPWPAAVDDAFCAFQELIGDLGADPKSTAVCGDSAGGGLAVALCLRLLKKNLPVPGALYLMSPWTNLADSNKSIAFEMSGIRTPVDFAIETMARIYAGENDLAHPEISPVFADLSGLPPMLLQAGTAEIMRNDGAAFAKRARECGVSVLFEPYQGLFHALPVLTRFSGTARDLLDRGGRFIQENT
jgi:acetyl esterase/lipase